MTAISANASEAPAGSAPNGWPQAMLRGFREGAPEALRDVYRAHVDEVGKQLRFGFSFLSRGRAHRFVGYDSAFDFHDALHETFRRAFEPRARQGYDGIRPYGPYLKTIARNVVLRGFRAKERLFAPIDAGGDEETRGPTLADDRPSPEQTVAASQVQTLVREFLATLDHDDRRLLEVRFVEGRSQRDAAPLLGLGRQQIRGREAKLRKRLVEYLAQRGETGWLPDGAGLALLCLTTMLAEAWP